MTALPGDTHTSHPTLRNRVSVAGGVHQPHLGSGGGPGTGGVGVPGGGHFTQVTLSDDDCGSGSDKVGPYKTTTNINRSEFDCLL